MSLHLLPLVIPFLFILIGLEYRYSKRHGLHAYRFETTVLNISCGIIERIFDVFILAGVYLFYNYLQSRFGVFDLPSTWWVWGLCFIAVDFIVYWYHYGGHKINFLWASHVAHHQCEEYNLTVAFRNHVLPNIFRGALLGVLPLLGFSGKMVIVCLSISGLYQFLLHTESVRKLGWLEYIVTTPSSHRVHHASNKDLLDKNFGGFFIIWDRLFGTYMKETEGIKYGITSGYSSYNPVVAYTHVWKDLFRVNKIASGWKEKVGIWFGLPSEFYEKYANDVKIPIHYISVRNHKNLIRYVSVQLIVAIILSILVLIFEEIMTPVQLILTTSSLIFSAISISTLMENENYILIEKVRITIIGVLLLVVFQPPMVFWVLALLMIGLSFLGLEFVKNEWSLDD